MMLNVDQQLNFAKDEPIAWPTKLQVACHETCSLLKMNHLIIEYLFKNK